MFDLKPCPFCGNPPARLVSIDGKTHISCLNYKCPCQPETAAYKTKGTAVRAWNRRADNVGYCPNCGAKMDGGADNG